MELFERESYLQKLHEAFKLVSDGIGHTILIAGEAGLGKTSLVGEFSKKIENKSLLLSGSCDQLFTPRPLSPLFDIRDKLNHSLRAILEDSSKRSLIFTSLLEFFNSNSRSVVFIIEDIHWADETTLDLIKFLGRRISRSNCLLVLTYRDNEIQENNTLKYVISDLPINDHTHLILENLSEDAVYNIASSNNVSGRKIYEATKGHPFFVSEIIAHPQDDIPKNISDSILSRVRKLSSVEEEILELISLFPKEIEIEFLLKLRPKGIDLIENIIKSKLLVNEGNVLRFKHDISKQVVYKSISSFKRIYLHNMVLEEINIEEDHSNLALLVHHAKNANRTSLVAQWAPIAASKASEWGAHNEAAKLYKKAIDCVGEIEDDKWIELLENYSYECFLTNEIEEGRKARHTILKFLADSNDYYKIGSSYRWLSRIHYNNIENDEAFKFAVLSIENLERVASPTKELAQAYSNLGQLHMVKHNLKETLYWCNKAIDLAKKLDDKDTLANALINLGTIYMTRTATVKKGESYMKKAIDLAKDINNHFHIVRVYGNSVDSYITQYDLENAKGLLKKGIDFSIKHEIDLFLYYFHALESNYYRLIGDWERSVKLANKVLSVPNQVNINIIQASIPKSRILMRTGQKQEAEELLIKMGKLAISTHENQRIIPIALSMLEFEWLYDYKFDDQAILDYDLKLNGGDYSYSWYESELAFWRYLNKKDIPSSWKIMKIHKKSMNGSPQEAFEEWTSMGCKYYAGMSLVTGNEEEKRQALNIFNELDASATVQKLRSIMKKEGIKSIPKGIRSSTKSNPAMLTNRQLDVLRELGNGLQNIEIANKLFISSKTVEHHISSIFVKLDVTSRSKAVIKAKELRILV